MNDLQQYATCIQYLLPEICVVVAVLLTAVWNLFVPKAKEWTPFFALLGLTSAMFFLMRTWNTAPIAFFNGLFTVDHLTTSFGLLVCMVGAIVVLMTVGYEHHLGRNRGEFYAILLTAVVSVMLLAGSTDLIMVFVSLETLSICCVILAGFSKTDARSSEAALKYLLSTAATTATLLYGLSFLYGMTGSTSFQAIRERMEMPMSSPTEMMGSVFLLILLLSAIGFKLSLVPFHMWTPDVYEGAPTPVTAFLSIGSKAGGFVVALRLLIDVFGKQAQDWVIVVSALAILSMVVGNLVALPQKSFKRMLAYSSIAHVGYIMIGLLAMNHEGLGAMMYYIVVYGFMNLGAFAGAILFSNETGSDKIDDYAGLIRKRPLLCLGMAVCLFNLAGLPIPPAGFFAKIFVFWAGSSIQQPVGGIPLGAILIGVALATSVPAIYYYTQVVIKMIVDKPSAVVEALPKDKAYIDSPQEAPALALIMCIIVIVATGTVAVDPVMKFSKEAVKPLIAHPSTGPSPVSLFEEASPFKRSTELAGTTSLPH